MKESTRGRLVLNSIGNSRGAVDDSSAVFDNTYAFSTEIPWGNNIKEEKEYQGRYKINYDTGEIEVGSLTTARYETINAPVGVNQFYLNRKKILNKNSDSIGSKGDSSLVFSDEVVFKNEKDLSETLSESGDYKVDYENGIVYTHLVTGYSEIDSGTSLVTNVEKMSSERVHGNIKGIRRFNLDYNFILSEDGSQRATYNDTSVMFQDNKVFGREFEYQLNSINDASGNPIRLLGNNFIRSKKETIVNNATGNEGGDTNNMFKAGEYGIVVGKEYQTYGDRDNLTNRVLCNIYKNGIKLVEGTDYDNMLYDKTENLSYGDSIVKKFDFSQLGIDDESLTVNFEPYYNPLNGDIYYVSTTGSDGNPGTESQPFRTIAYATLRARTAFMANGGTGFYAIVVEDGTYDESSDEIYLYLSNQDATKGFLRLIARHVGKAIIVLGGSKAIRLSYPGFYGGNCSIEGFIITQVYTTLTDTAVSPSDIVVNVTSTSGFATSGTAYISDDSFVYTNKTTTSFTGVSGITNNHYSGERVSPGLMAFDFSLDPYYGLPAIGNVIIRNNVIVDFIYGIYSPYILSGPNAGTGGPTGNILVEHNVIINNVIGAFVEETGETETDNYFIIKHNTFMQNNTSLIIQGADPAAGPSVTVIQYNDFWLNGKDILDKIGSQVSTTTVNNVKVDSSNIYLSPMFVDSTSGTLLKRNYRLLADSKLREAGEEIEGNRKDIGIIYPDYILSHNTGVNAVDQLIFSNPLGSGIRPVVEYKYASGFFALDIVIAAGDIIEAEYMERSPAGVKPINPSDLSDYVTTNVSGLTPQDTQSFFPVDISNEDPIVQETNTKNSIKEKVTVGGGYCIDYDRAIVYTTLDPTNNLEVSYKAADPKNVASVGFAFAAEYSTSVDYKYMRNAAGTADYTFQEEYDLTNVEIGGINSTILNTDQFKIAADKNEGKLLPKPSTELAVTYTWQKDVDLVLNVQPVAPTYLDITVAGGDSARNITFTGTTVFEGENLQATYIGDWIFEVPIPTGAPAGGEISRVLRVYNATQNYTYIITNYYLKDTFFDSTYAYGGIYGVGVAKEYGYSYGYGGYLENNRFRIDPNIDDNSAHKPLVSDTVYVDYLWSVPGDSETVDFITNVRKVTSKRFWIVNKITTEKKNRDYTIGTPTIIINSMNEPVEGDTYNVDYEYTTPQEGETITVTYLYNKAIHDVTDAIMTKDIKVRDFLVKQAKGVAINLSANVIIDSVYRDLPLATGISIQDEKRILIEERINDYYEEVGLGDVIKLADITKIIRNEDGVIDAVVTLLAKEGFTGTSDITLLDNEKLIIGITTINVTIAEV